MAYGFDYLMAMLLVEDIEDRDLLAKLFDAMYEELPEPKKKK